jgi:hypothetical protein
MFSSDEDGGNMNEFLRLDGKTIHILNTGQSTFIGRHVGNNDNGSFLQNVAIGDSSMFHNISGQRNVGIGFGTFRFGTGGSENTPVGYN